MERLTIKEFAERAGVSTQAIYKAVRKENGRLSPYVIQENNRYYINPTALTEVYKVGIIENNLTTNQPTQKPTAEVENQPILQPTNQPETNPFTTYLLSQIDELKAEIERYKGIVQEKDNTIQEMAGQIADIANRALITTTNQQQLSAMEKQPAIDEVAQPHKGIIKRLFSKKERN